MLHTRKKARAFTLVEILVVVVILGIASAVILPQLGTRDDLRASSATRKVMADLIYAQNLAITSQSPRYIIFTASGYSIHTSPTAPAITHPIDKSPFVVTFGTGELRGVALTNWNFGGSAVMGFDELGAPFSYSVANTPPDAPLGSRGAIEITSGAFSLTINLEPFTGELTVE